MTNEELNAALYEKMSAEQDQFTGWLLKLAPEEMLEHSFEYTIRQDILISVEDGTLTSDQALALLRSETPLADVYREYQKQQSGYIDDVRDSIVVHIAAANGRWCGAKRPRSGGSGRPLVMLK